MYELKLVVRRRHKTYSNFGSVTKSSECVMENNFHVKAKTNYDFERAMNLRLQV